MRDLVIVAALLLSLLGAEVRDPVIGTWELDLSKSTFDPGPPPKSQTRRYVETPAGMRFTLTGVSATGAPVHVEYTAACDGKDHPLTGSPSSNSISLKCIDRLHMEADEKKGGRVVFVVTRVISPDEKMMTVTSTGTNAKGVAIRNVMVFRRR